ncbi:hypothetical protein [Streptomyces sp. LUP30]|uniref:hypothetical protein n=1 Tax=Streptomyces sp. LUP30 TaxID=1890285 RepID=UPI00114CFAB3|nr:hypothetical protein [Streptomyces sp. LUP30]
MDTGLLRTADPLLLFHHEPTALGLDRRPHGALGAGHNLCLAGCWPGRAPRPAAAGVDSPYRRGTSNG